MSNSTQLSIICKNFAQNAWKKDLCSNCFKSEIEHKDSFFNIGCNPAHSTTISLDSTDHDSQNATVLKCKTSTTHSANLISQTNFNSNQCSNHIKTLNININQTSIVVKNNKSVNDCQNTTTATKLQSNRKSFNCVNNSEPSLQILMNTKKINSNNISTHNMSDISQKTSNKISLISKDSLKDDNLNNCLELRKVINSKVSLNNDSNNDFINSKTVEKNNYKSTKDPKQQNFPQSSQTKEIILSQTNVKNNNSLNDIRTQVLNNSSKSTSPEKTKMPLTGILKTEATNDLIKYQPKNKCLVFKEGDPLIIGFGIDEPFNDCESDEENSDNYEEEEESDDFDDDEQLYTSDDKELRELTRENTKFNSNFANFSINNINNIKVKQNINQTTIHLNDLIDSKVVLSEDNNQIDSKTNISSDDKTEDSLVINISNDCQNEEKVPKTLENNLIKTTEDLNESNCEPIKSQSPDSCNSDILPMSTSSDSYSSSSCDEKEDYMHSEQTIVNENTNKLLSVTQNIKPLLEAKHLRTDLESDNSSTNSDSGLEIKDYKRKEEIVKTQNNCRTKPQLPIKPNITSVMRTTLINEEKIIQNSVTESTESKNIETESEEKSSLQMCGQIYESNDNFNETEDKSEDKSSTSFESNKTFVSIEKSIEIKPLNEAIRDIKLAELAHELEQVRYSKRQAPQPPIHDTLSLQNLIKEDMNQKNDPIVDKHYSNCDQMMDKFVKTNGVSNTSTKTDYSKPNRFSIRKLLNKKSDKLLSLKSKDESNDFHHSDSGSDLTGNTDRKAWKQSEFDRSNLKIVHPLDITPNNDIKTVCSDIEIDKQTIEERPEAPPRTPKPSRPSVPARRRKQTANGHQLQPRGEPPPPPTTPPPSLNIKTGIPQTKGSVVESSSAIINNDLNEAYNQLAKSNLTNLLAIKSKIESTFEQNQYKWSDFDVTQGVRLGSALLYRDSIVSKSKESVNLLVLSDCYSSPIVTKFRHHSDLVMVLDEEWTEYHLLSEISIEMQTRKSMNSLILQLFSILENLETNQCNDLTDNTIDKIIICGSKLDSLLIVPIDHSVENDNISSNHLTLHQFLAQVLTKLLPDSLFGSIDSQILSRPSIPISHSKIIVELIVFQIPVQQMNRNEDNIRQINYWFDINRSKIINQFCFVSIGSTKLLTNLDYIYLKFLCNHRIDLIQNSISHLVNNTKSQNNLDIHHF